MINARKMTIGEFRKSYKESDSLLNEIVEIRMREKTNKSAFDAFTMVLIGGQYPSSRHCDIIVEKTDIKKGGSFKTNFSQNGSAFWNFKDDDGSYYDVIYGDKIDGTDDRKLSNKMKDLIERCDNPEMTIDECFQDLIKKIEISSFSTAEFRKKKVENLEKCYDQFINIPPDGNPDSIHKKLKKLIENGVHQMVLTGAPGTGKTFSVQKFAESFPDTGEIDGKKYALVQFHSSYDYTDFVEGLRPVQLKKGETTFVKLDGIFKHFCRRVAEENSRAGSNAKNNKYFFIIDEINRADLSRVFGELMYGLEENYRNKRFDTQYKNLPTYQVINKIAVPIKEKEDIFEDGFYIPENVYIIGTMNDIDRSVEAFDFALRRRFQWIEVKANNVMKDALEEMQKKEEIHSDIDLIKLAESAYELNKVISGDEGKRLGLSDAYHVGPAYLKTKAADTLEAKKEIWEYRIEPILKEYCRGYNNEEFIAICKLAFEGAKNDKE